MEDREQFVKEIAERIREDLAEEFGDLRTELSKLRWRATTMEILFGVLWTTVSASSGKTPQEAVRGLLGIVDELQKSGESGLSAVPEDEREARLSAFAEAMKNVKQSFSLASLSSGDSQQEEQ